jgi:hypothetical protein
VICTDLRLYMDIFLPQVQLVARERAGAKVRQRTEGGPLELDSHRLGMASMAVDVMDRFAAAVAVVGSRVKGPWCRRRDLSAGKEGLWTAV